MIQATDKYIAITRGDCGIINVSIGQNDGDEWEMGKTDILELTVRNYPDSASPVMMHITSNPGSKQLVLQSDDTQILPGRYSADIQLNHNGCYYTIWPEMDLVASCRTKNWKNFIVGAEVTIREWY